MSDLPQDFDLKFLPDWLKESPAVNRYADYQGETSDRPRRDRDDRRPQGPRPERRGPPPPRGSERRGPRPDRPQGDRPRGARPGGDRPRDGRPQDRRDDARPPREAPRQAPAALQVELLPEPNAAAGIARQIKTSGRAYAVFGTSKLFLERPERHRVRLTSSDPAVPLFQIADGPISFDRALVERNAFFAAKDEYYTEEKVEGEPIKGNFSNVARVRSTGALLGPTNHHSYQPALRKLYEERFARRMPFHEFQQHEIEVVSDEQAVADWKEQARSSTTFTTTKEADPVTFKSLSEAEQHFRKHYLPQLVKSGPTLDCGGPAIRSGADRFVDAAVRDAWEQESRFPQQVVNGLRPYLMEAGLHFFKHRKRVLYVSANKPVRHPTGQIFSDGITAILSTVEAAPRIKRPDLATKILGEVHDSPEATARKAQLAADLHYLIHAGHVIEFSDGALELPLPPIDKPAPERPARPKAATASGTLENVASTSEAAGEDEATDAPGDENAPLAESPESAVQEAPMASEPAASATASEVVPPAVPEENGRPPTETV